jgi:hypothetical protein
MKKLFLISIIVVVIFGGATLRYEASYGQTATPVFVVYGTMTTKYGNPVEGVYTIVLENLRSGAVVEDDIGVGENAGKYAGVFIDYSGGNAVLAGDVILVSVRIGPNPVTGFSELYEVTLEDILDMRVVVDIIEPEVAVDSKTWGSIKSLYQ